eukprot:3717702-Rhodomonas_salina.3
MSPSSSSIWDRSTPVSVPKQPAAVARQYYHLVWSTLLVLWPVGFAVMQCHYCPKLPSRACVGGDAVTNLESQRCFGGWRRAFSVAYCRPTASEKSEDQGCAAAP